MEYWLLVIAPTVLDVVVYTGGYLFDQSMAGWRVKAAVHAAGHRGVNDNRPLDILGVEATDLQSALTECDPERSAGVVVVCAHLHEQDPAVRRLVRAAVADVRADVLMWDQPTCDASPDSAYAVGHRLSHAARAFKRLALSAATGTPRDTEATETFRTAVPARVTLTRTNLLAIS